MASRKKVKIEVEASLSNLGDVKKSLQEMSKQSLSPFDSAEIKRALKMIQEVYDKFPDRKFEIDVD